MLKQQGLKHVSNELIENWQIWMSFYKALYIISLSLSLSLSLQVLYSSVDNGNLSWDLQISTEE